MPCCPSGSGTSTFVPLFTSKLSLEAVVRATTWVFSQSEPPTLFLPSTLALKVQTTSGLVIWQVP